MPAPTSTPVTLDTLDRLICEELAMVDRYAQALTLFGVVPCRATAALEENRHCHRARVPLLTNRVLQLAGQPPTAAGAWGTQLPLVPGASRAAVVAALEEQEDAALSLYCELLGRVDAETAHLLRQEVLPKQETTHHRLAELIAAVDEAAPASERQQVS